LYIHCILLLWSLVMCYVSKTKNPSEKVFLLNHLKTHKHFKDCSSSNGIIFTWIARLLLPIVYWKDFWRMISSSVSRHANIGMYVLSQEVSTLELTYYPNLWLVTVFVFFFLTELIPLSLRPSMSRTSTLRYSHKSYVGHHSVTLHGVPHTQKQPYPIFEQFSSHNLRPTMSYFNNKTII
jgi:hypothetical protein